MAFRAWTRSYWTRWRPTQPRPGRFAGKSTALTALCLTAGFLFWPSAIPEGMATPLNAWEHRCVGEDDSAARVCTTEIVMRYHEHDFLFYFARGPAGPVPFIAQSDGLGFGRMVVTVDGKDVLEADRCEVGMCFFEERKSHKLIRLFRKGKTAHVLIEDLGSRTLFDAELTLTGFTAAYRRYR